MVMDEIIEFVVILIVIGFCALSFIAVANRATFRVEVMKIEQLRHDVKTAPPADKQAILGLAAKVNQKIKSNQLYNHIWFSDWVIPDGWDNVKPIDVSGGSCADQYRESR